MARLVDPRVRRVIGANLKRQLRGKNTKVVADDVEMSVGQLYGYSNGLRGFSLETLLRFAVALNCSIDDLVAGVDAEYTRAVMKRRRSDLVAELERDEQLLDVLAGFEVMRKTNPPEAETVATMFRARLVQSGEVLLDTAKANAEPPTAEAERGTGTSTRGRRVRGAQRSS